MNQFNYETIWNEAIKSLKKELSEIEISGWIEPLKYVSNEEETIILAVSSAFLRDQIIQRYKRKIEKILNLISGNIISIKINIDKSIDNEDNETEYDETKETKRISLNNVQEKKISHPDLNEAYTFDNFIIGSGNKFAANAAIATARNPSESYNPFFIYGGVGLGKTHLLQAIGNYIWKSSNSKVLFVTAETFVTEFIQALNSGPRNVVSMASFKKKYRNVDVLLIDDVQLLEGKVESQEEIFNTFNHLYQNKKQMVFTSDRPPSELKFQERLRSRFQRGLVVDVRMPEYETRCAILKKKNEVSKEKVSSEVIDFIARNVSSSVRDLEAMLTKAQAYIKFTDKPLTLEVAKTLLINDIAANTQVNITIDVIKKEVSEYFNVSIADIESKKKPKSLVLPRHIAMYLSREMTECSSTEIGKAFGGRDHGSVLNAHSKIEKRMISEPSIQTAVTTLENLIKEKNVSK